MSEKCPVFLLSYSPNSKNGFRRDLFFCGCIWWHVTEIASYLTNYRLKQCLYGYLRVLRSFMACFATSLHRVELRTSSSSYVPARRCGDFVLGGPQYTSRSHAVTRYWPMDLDIFIPSQDLGYVASAFLNFALCFWFRGWASLSCINIRSIGICTVGLSLKFRW